MRIQGVTFESKMSHSYFQDLQYTFTHLFGNRMMIEGNPDWNSLDVSPLQRNMIEANEISKLLKLTIREIDQHVQLMYHIDNKRMLSHVLPITGLTTFDFYKVAIQLLITLEESKNYMLDYHNYLLDLDFIFIGEDVNEIYFTYMPLKNKKTCRNLYMQVMHVLRQLQDYVSESNRHQLSPIFQFTEINFTCVKLNELLMKMLVEHQEKHSPPATMNQRSQVVKHSLIDQMIDRTSDDESNVPDIKHNYETIPEQKDLPFIPLSSRLKILSSILIILLLGLIWKSVYDLRNESLYYVAFLLSGIIILVGSIIMSRGYPRNLKIKSWGIGWKESKTFIPEFVHEKYSPSINRYDFDSTEIGERSEHYYNQLELHTKMIASHADHTILLSTSSIDNVSRKKESIVPILTYYLNQEKKQIYVEKEVFRIGRGSNEVDFEISELGVSRHHAEIIKIEEAYWIKDLQSKNGVYLNQVRLVPYQPYLLKDGDKIEILRYEMLFSWEHHSGNNF